MSTAAISRRVTRLEALIGGNLSPRIIRLPGCDHPDPPPDARVQKCPECFALTPDAINLIARLAAQAPECLDPELPAQRERLTL